MAQLLAYDKWATQLSMTLYAVAKEGGGRILLHRGGPGCNDGHGASCPCIPGIVEIDEKGNVR